ncbi:MAG: hypothetical protein P9L99_05820 [Candidatus Lernaella stagnicola]|nr:hypothetical protein [Candidatus Lernaella stagnicola]
MHDADRPLISPTTTTKLRRAVTPRVVLVPLRKHLQGYLAHLGVDRRRARNFGESRYYEPPTPGAAGVIGPFLGAPHAAVVAEEAVALGAKELLFFGLAGALDDSLRFGDLCLVESAHADEGVSPTYFPGERDFAADPELLDRLKAHFEQCGLATQRQKVWTTGTLFYETPARVATYREKGCSLVEMEISALYAVARLRKVRAAAVVVVSDNVGSGRWRPGFMRPRYRRQLHRALGALASFGHHD